MTPTHYLLFAGDNYYPIGGAEDCRGVYPIEAGAREAGLELTTDANQECPDWIHLAALTESGLSIIAEIVSYSDTDSPRTNRFQWSDGPPLVWVARHQWIAHTAHYHPDRFCCNAFRGEVQPMIVRQSEAEARGMTACPHYPT